MGQSGRCFGDDMDNEANDFAIKLLIPEDQFIKKIKNGENSVKELALYFKVSTILISERCKQLGFKRIGKIVPFGKCDAKIVKK